jgi:hypothetical protein
MTSDGGNYNQITESLLHLAGMLLPVLVCYIVTIFYNRNFNNMFYKYFSLMFSIITIGSIFAWIIVPIIAIFSTPPVGDDVTLFLSSSQINPLIIILVAILLITIMVLTASFKGVIKPYIDLIKQGVKRKVGA